MLGEEIAAILPEMRAHADSLMVASCVIERLSGRVLDEVTLEYVDTWTLIYAGKCRVKVVQSVPRDPAPGGRAFVITDALVQLPVQDVDFTDDDRVTITGSTFDPVLPGVVLTVVSRELREHATMRRLHVAEVVST